MNEFKNPKLIGFLEASAASLRDARLPGKIADEFDALLHNWTNPASWQLLGG